LEILKRARGPNDGDIVPFGPPPAGLQDELNLRLFKAGHTDRDGQPKDLPKIRIFGGLSKTKLNIWPRDSEDNLIDD
jgi:hypothetical protein